MSDDYPTLSAADIERRDFGDLVPLAQPHHRYDDCASFSEGDTVDLDDSDSRPVTCPACREWLGLNGVED